MAADAFAMSTIVAKAVVTLAKVHPKLELTVIDRHRLEALQLLRRGEIDVAVVRSAATPIEEEGFRLVDLVDDPIYLVSQRPDDSLAHHRHSAWIGGCERCTEELIAVCQQEGFTPRIASQSDDMVVVQALIAAGVGVTLLPGQALQAHRRPDIHAALLPGICQPIHAVTYGDPPDPPAVATVLAILADRTYRQSP